MKKFITVLVAAVMLIVTCIPAAYAAKETKYTLTKELDRVRRQHDGGYSVIEEIGKDDPHYGWGLGSFYITGYTEVVKDENGNPVFLKNVGDELVLGFDLKKNIDKLGKNERPVYPQNVFDRFPAQGQLPEPAAGGKAPG